MASAPKNKKKKDDLSSSDSVMSSARSLTAISAGAGPEAEPGAYNARDHVSSLARGLEILRAFSRTGKRMTLSEVSAETGLTRAATRRFLLTLVREGYSATDGKYFDLTPRVLELGYSVLSRIGTWDLAKPFLEKLSKDVEESVSAAVLDGSDVVSVCCVQYHRIITVGVAVGTRLPACCTATGRILLAAQPPETWDDVIKSIRFDRRTAKSVTSVTEFREILQRTRAEGYCLVDQELEVGLLSIATPIRTYSGKIIAAANIGIPTVRATPEHMIAKVLPKLRETCERLAGALPG